MKIMLDLNDEQIKKLSKAARAGGLPDVAQTIKNYVGEEEAEIDQKYRDAVQTGDGKLEVDGDAIVSKGGDDGAYVQCWVWVSDEDAGVEEDE